ncbi:AAA family ATPase [Polaribacter sp. HL-MS24]|nr:AAA family ATPase [Polaribacter sp. HL-MS24]WOC41312.1 AAA family ATPase [Polaribacter sp. HL-MS24]
MYVCSWEEIYISDNERYETFEQAQFINTFIEKAYEQIGYKMINVPFGSITDRSQFILNSLEHSL